MRVFLNVTYDLKKVVRFQKTIPFLAEVLQMLNLAPGRTMFAFEDVEERDNCQHRSVLDGMAKMFPELKGYKRPFFADAISGMSNFPAVCQGEFSVPMKDANMTVALFSQLAEKIPRPYSLYSASIILDHIPWLGKSSRIPALNLDLVDTPCALDAVVNNYGADCGFYQSDCIVLDKRFDWGIAHNPVHFRFEVTDFIESKNFSPVDSLVDELSKLLGVESKQKQMVCCFEGKRIHNISAAASRFRRFLEEKSCEWKGLSMPSGHSFGDSCVSADYCADFKCPPRIPFFKKQLKNCGFVWNNPLVDGISEFSKISHKGNYSINISPWFNRKAFYARLDCMGYNFRISHMLASQRWCNSLRDAELCAAGLRWMINLWETEMVPELERLFGETPDWYHHSNGFTDSVGQVLHISKPE